MDDLGDELVSLAVTATSPDGQIRVALGDQGKKLEVTFHPGSYRRYSEAALANQLSRLAMRVTASYVRAQSRLIDEAIPDVLHDDGIEYGPEDREYRRRVRAIKTGAKSPDGRIVMVSLSLVRWAVRISDGTVRAVPEETFTSGLVSTVHEVLARHQSEVLKLKDEYYDSGISDAARRRAELPKQHGSG